MPNLRKLLFPFSLIYHGVTEVRNKLYDAGILNSTRYDIPIIAVGNLNMGGTGKSPMIEYLIEILGKDHVVASLSRGYKRESEGFQLVEISDSVAKSGDEPLQFKIKFPETIVAVDANRREGIEELKKYSPDLILLDDAFQHRKVQAGLYILLTAFGDLYTDDFVLPVGNLRESSKGAERAQIIIVTKCPDDLSSSEMSRIRKKLKPSLDQSVFFSSIKYAGKIISTKEELALNDIEASDFVLVTGIARPKPLIEFLGSKNIELEHFKFPDHHNFTEKEISKLKEASKILTTEKDYMRLKDKLPLEKLYYLPIEVEFLDHGKANFDKKIMSYVNEKEV
ncbi:tetraacyldisaccharide 4'-kinase [Christiangramia echinicola]|uniref:tetraacyldisaccharide 4'-kinase n=1 Tax=Christiangramia echinicola TaxID=279359 RepID=UPI0003F71DC4|nr:tetraacyldisaccharide 4'-kinase [Christiangramia echinicola]